MFLQFTHSNSSWGQAGDTTVVQTFTCDAQNNPQTAYDSPGRRWFDFPASNNGKTYQKILNEALEELKQEHFQDLYEAELKKSNHFVKDTLLETDFEILIPDEYVGSITERISLYKELDDLEKEEQMQDFIKNMVDRFGPIPEPAITA